MVSGGETSGYGILTVRENIWMFSQFYGVPTSEANERIAAMLKVVELEDKANARVSGLSTGQRQRMNFCRGFVTDPKVIFLDEPTLGLDVNAARMVRDFTREWMRQRPDRTVLLTTHYMAEADELCDRIAIIDHGTVLACDTPGQPEAAAAKAAGLRDPGRRHHCPQPGRAGPDARRGPRDRRGRPGGQHYPAQVHPGRRGGHRRGGHAL